MNLPPDPDEISDDEAPLLAELGRAVGSDPVPDGLIERAAGLVAWFDVDAEIAALLDEAAEPAGTRGGTTTAVRFATADRSTEIELDIDGDRIVGFVLAGSARSVVAVRADGHASPAVEVDDLGRFELVAGAGGPHRLRLVDPVGAAVMTDWFVLGRHDDERTI